MQDTIPWRCVPTECPAAHQCSGGMARHLSSIACARVRALCGRASTTPQVQGESDYFLSRSRFHRRAGSHEQVAGVRAHLHGEAGAACRSRILWHRSCPFSALTWGGL